MALLIAQQRYLNQLIARGSNADMIKTHAVICKKNRKRRHLQMDTNIHIHSYQRLYEKTFACEDDAIAVALNASYYDADYVSAHNKIIYMVPGSKFRNELIKKQLAWCREHGEDHTKPDHVNFKEAKKGESQSKVEKINKNSIYSKVFAPALKEIGFTMEGRIGCAKTIYPACMDEKEVYRLTDCVILAVNQSWKEEKDDLGYEKDQKLANSVYVQIDDAICNLLCYKGAVKKFTGLLYKHKRFKKNLRREELQDPTLQIKRAQEREEAEIRAHNKLLGLSDQDVDKRVVKKFYEAVRGKVEKERSLENVENLERITEEFPDSIRGNLLTRGLFRRTISQLRRRAENYEKSTVKDESKQQGQSLTLRLE